MTVPDWYNDAACQNTDPAIFFPDNGAYQRARAICNRCTVTAECLGTAFREEEADAGNRHGMRGGLTPAERNAIAGTGRTERDPILADLAARGIYDTVVDIHDRALGQDTAA